MTRALAFLASTAFACAAAPAWAAPAMQSDTVDASVPTQLPRTAVPHHYAIAVTPHAERLAFDGTVAIDLEIVKPTSCAGAERGRPPILQGHAHRTGQATDRRADFSRCRRADGRVRPRPVAGAGPISARHRLFGQDQHPGQRAVRARLQECRGQGRALAVHPVRGCRRAPLRPQLG